MLVVKAINQPGSTEEESNSVEMDKQNDSNEMMKLAIKKMTNTNNCNDYILLDVVTDLYPDGNNVRCYDRK